MDTPKQARYDLFERIRNHRLTATFALLATLSIGIVAGSILTQQSVDAAGCDAERHAVPRDGRAERLANAVDLDGGERGVFCHILDRMLRTLGRHALARIDDARTRHPCIVARVLGRRSSPAVRRGQR